MVYAKSRDFIFLNTKDDKMIILKSTSVRMFWVVFLSGEQVLVKANLHTKHSKHSKLFHPIKTIASAHECSKTNRTTNFVMLLKNFQHETAGRILGGGNSPSAETCSPELTVYRDALLNYLNKDLFLALHGLLFLLFFF